MQYSIIMSGIGGQGIVVGTKLIGITATEIGLFCLHYAEYGGEMRGTKCECTLTVGDQPVTSTPQVSSCAAAIIMHPESFDHLHQMIEPGGLALVNSSLIDVAKKQLRSDVEWVLLPITDMGKALGHMMVATMVAIGAFAEETGIIPALAIKDFLPEVIPAYRHQLLKMDSDGIDIGANAIARREEVRIPSASAPYVFTSRRPLAGSPVAARSS